MKSRTLPLLTVIVAAIHGLLSAKSPGAITDPLMSERAHQVLVEKLNGTYEISEDERQALIKHILKRREERRRDTEAFYPNNDDVRKQQNRTDDSYLISALIVLGHEPTIRERVKTEGDAQAWRRALWASGSPVAIEVLIPLIFKDEPFYDELDYDVWDSSFTHGVAKGWITDIIMRSNSFSPAVKEWARHVRSSGFAALAPGDEAKGRKLESEWALKAVRQWWDDNKQLFAERKYEDVKPGATPPWPYIDFSKATAVPDPVPEKSPQPVAEKKVQDLAPPPPATPEPRSSSTRSDSEASAISEKSGVFVAILLVVGAAIASLIYFWRRRSKTGL